MTMTELNQLTNTPAIRIALKHEIVPIQAVKKPKISPKHSTATSMQAVMRVTNRLGQQIAPIIVDERNRILAGVEIFDAMVELGAEHVAVVRLNDLSSAEVKALTLLFAKLPELSKWDDGAVVKLINEIIIEDPDVIDIIGFEMAEIDIAIDVRGEAEQEDAATEKDDDRMAGKALSDFAPSNSVSEIGDLFIAGEHRLICANCLDEVSYAALMAGEMASATITDPPFNIRIAGNVSGLGQTKHGDFAMGVGEMSFDEFTAFLAGFLVLMKAWLVPGGLAYVFMDRRHLEELHRAARQAALNILDLCIWNKKSGGMGGLYRSQHEPCLVLKHGTTPHTNNVKLGAFGRCRTNVWDHAGMSSFGKGRKEALAAHPTVKPWTLMAEIIKDCTARGDIILDPFIGSGSCMLAAEKTGRRCFGIELEPKYVDVAIARFEKMTGKQAIHAATGLTFSELKKQRQQTSFALALPAPGPNTENGHD